MPAINRHGIAALAIVVGKHGRELLEHHVRRKFFPAIVVPGFRIKRVIVASADGIVPLPRIERSLLRVRGGQHLRNALSAFSFLIHGKLVRPHRLIFVDTALDVPARKVAAISARESSGAEAADRSALPVTVVNHSRGRESGLASSGIFQRHTDAALPGGFGNGVAGKTKWGEQKTGKERGEWRTHKQLHELSSTI